MILYFLFPIKGPINGVKIISKRILENLKQEDFEIIEIDTAQSESYSNFGKFNLTKIYFFNSILKRLKNVAENDIVYMNFSTSGFSKYRDFAILLYLNFKKAKTVLHIHANNLEKINIPFAKAILRKSKIIVINEHQLKSLKFSKNIICIKNSLPDFYNNSFPLTISKNENELKLLFMSNLSEKKGIDLLKKICFQIQEKKLPYKLTICGGILDEYSSSCIKEIKKLNFITYLGPISEEKVKMEIYRKHDILLFLSIENYEVFPLVYIEALMNGLPIITTKQRISNYIINNESGVLIESDDIEVTIKKLMQNFSLFDLKKKARLKYEKEFNFDLYYNAIKRQIFNGF